MDTVMVLRIRNVALPISSVVDTGTDMRRTCVLNDKREQAQGLTHSLPDSPEVFEKGKALSQR